MLAGFLKIEMKNYIRGCHFTLICPLIFHHLFSQKFSANKNAGKTFEEISGADICTISLIIIRDYFVPYLNNLFLYLFKNISEAYFYQEK